MKYPNKEFYDDWLSDNISDLRKEWCSFNPDEFQEYCKAQFNQWAKDND